MVPEWAQPADGCGGGWTASGIFTARSGTPFSIYDYTWNIHGYSGVPRIVPSTQITHYKFGSATNVGASQFQVLAIPSPDDAAPFNPTLGISDFGPFPSNMTGQNAFRGPGAWNFDAAVAKKFRFTKHTDLEFRAEGFDVGRELEPRHRPAAAGWRDRRKGRPEQHRPGRQPR